MTRLRAGLSGVRMPVGVKIFHFSKTSRRLWGPPNLPIQWVPRVFPGVKRPGRGVEHSPTSSAKAKNE